MSTPSFENGIVTSPHFLASQAGRDVLKMGGNAVEAAVAVAATLAVVYPHMTGLGGDSFWLVRSPVGELFAIDACGAAGENVDLQLYADAGLDSIPFRGPLAAITTAGTVSGWAHVLAEAGGSLPLDALLGAAIDHAKNGVKVTQSGAAVAENKAAELAGNAGYASVFQPDGRPLQVGDILKQPALTRTLERLVQNGLLDFYTGEIGRDIIEDLAAAGSPITAAPYCRARRAWRRNSSSPSFIEIELTTHFPWTHCRPASMTSHFEESTTTGTRCTAASARRSAGVP